jgi:hypothetical protein
MQQIIQFTRHYQQPFIFEAIALHLGVHWGDAVKMSHSNWLKL